MSDYEQSQKHLTECVECQQNVLKCAEYRKIVNLEIRRLQYADMVRERAQENNPEWFRGSRQSPFFYEY